MLRHKETMTENTPLPPIRLAFVLDGRVQEILNTDTRLAAIFLSDPIVIDTTSMQVKLLSKYNPETGELSDPVFDSEGNLLD